MRSARRGRGDDLAGLRAYRPGDDTRLVDHRASARLSAASGRDELVVREHLTEEAVRVVVAVDPAPSMGLFPDGLPWLSKPAAVAEVRLVLAASAEEARCPFDDRSAEALDATSLPRGSFVFLVSDFLAEPEPAAVSELARRHELVPVVLQDPVWEQSFPEVGGVALPVAEAGGGRARAARLSSREAEERRRANEGRLARLLDGFAALGLDWVLVESHEPAAVLESLAAWAQGRRSGTRLAR
jgi:uncharacterized protein (DUF58 family)